MADLVSTIDAIATDIKASVSELPAKYTVKKYIPPNVITPEMCPLLYIVPGESKPILLSTESDYQREDEYLIAWAEDFSSMLTTGNADESKAIIALQRAKAIQLRLETYGVAIPGVTGSNEATLVKLRYGMTQGQGGIWLAEATLSVGSWE